MEEKDILSLSLASLLKIYPLQEGDLGYNGCVMGYREVMESEPALDLFHFPTRIDAFGIILCSKGSVTVTSDLKRCVIDPRTMFVFMPGTIVQVESRVDTAAHFILCEEDFINRIHIDLKQMLHLFMAVRENPCLALNDAEWGEITRAIGEIFIEGRNRRSDALSLEIMQTLFRALAYRLCRVIDDQIGKRSVEERESSSRDRSALYFNAFIETLSKNYMQERSVGFYADELNLTPKYLTTVIRKASGRTATDWINSFVILEAKNLLKYSTLSIQEIAYKLNFPNQSFFGKYFKNHTGQTPSAYRMND